MPTLDYDFTVSVANLVALFAVLVSLSTLLVATRKDRKLRKTQYADQIRSAAAVLTAKLGRWRYLAHGLFEEIQPVITSATLGVSLILQPTTSYVSSTPTWETLPVEQPLPVWSKNSNGLKWRGLEFCTGSLFEMGFSDPETAPTISLSRSYGLQGNPRCFGRACSPMSPEQ
jgi:hypothetical protein